jgi:hypothetical protein
MIQNQHLTDLERALGQLREQRRNWVRPLAAGAGHERGKTESAIESFLKCQTAIEAASSLPNGTLSAPRSLSHKEPRKIGRVLLVGSSDHVSTNNQTANRQMRGCSRTTRCYAQCSQPQLLFIGR